jgi:hypothetical protein
MKNDKPLNIENEITKITKIFDSMLFCSILIFLVIGITLHSLFFLICAALLAGLFVYMRTFIRLSNESN